MHFFSEHVRKDNMLSGIDARIKMIVALVVLAMVLTYKGFFFPLLVVVVCLGLCVKMKIPLKVFALRFSEPMCIAFVLILLKLFFTGREVFFSVHFLGLTITGHRDGLIEGSLIAARIIGAVSVIAALGFATPFTAMMSGLSWFRAPKGLIEILMFAYRYIFMLFEDAMVIYHAQKNRLGYSSLRRGLTSFGILAGSLTLKAFEHSQNATVAMVQRGYDGNMHVQSHKPFKPSEVVASVCFIVIMGFIWKI